MKYNFINKGKKLTTDDIKGQMNFDNMAKGASIWAGAKLGASLLKSTGITSTGFIAGASAVIITGAAVIMSSTGLLDDGLEQIKPDPTPIESALPISIDSLNSTSTTSRVTSLDSLIELIDNVEDKEAASASPKTINDVPERVMVVDSIRHVDVTTKARPLPDIQSFEAHIARELNYPIDPISVSVNENDEDLKQKEGYVEVFWTVDKQGNADNFKIRKSMGKSFDNEAIRVIKNYKNWEPGSFNGEAVDSNLSIKVYFNVK